MFEALWRRLALAGPAPATRLLLLRPKVVETKAQELKVEAQQPKSQLIQFRG